MPPAWLITLIDELKVGDWLKFAYDFYTIILGRSLFLALLIFTLGIPTYLRGGIIGLAGFLLIMGAFIGVLFPPEVHWIATLCIIGGIAVLLWKVINK